MSTNTYVLGLNAYDHDVSACLLRNGEIAYAISKERLTREKHDTGFFQEVIDYCLSAEGITLDDVDLVVRNCYVLPLEDLETRLLYEDIPEFMDAQERAQALKSPLFRAHSHKVITVSHHLAHAYSAFAACPFDEGVIMIVDGVGNYASDIHEDGPAHRRRQSARARVGELLSVQGFRARRRCERCGSTRCAAF